MERQYYKSTMELFYRILTNHMPRDINFYFNFVYLRDVAEGIISAASIGSKGKITGREPPLLSSQVELHYGVKELVDISKSRKELG